MQKEHKFDIKHRAKNSHARIGELHTPHGTIETPVFMPVGTQATVKTLTPEMLHGVSTQILLCNTYHLVLRPGIDLIKKFGGLHKMMHWDKPILTDSGGYQVFSLKNQRKITTDGVTFKSHLDGSTHHFTPQSVIDAQLAFNSDIMMPLDICSPYPSTKDQIRKDMALTHAWEEEAFLYWKEQQTAQWLFAIVQGGMFETCRQESIDFLTQLDFPGFAIGGLSVGEPREEMERLIAFTAPKLPENKPRYAMGIGLPENLVYAIHQGIDMFDCVIPTRLARHGQIFIGHDRVNIKRQEFKEDLSPIDPNCECYTCNHYSKAYIRHLYIAKESLAATLMSIHNIHTLIQIVETEKEKIKKKV